MHQRQEYDGHVPNRCARKRDEGRRQSMKTREGGGNGHDRVGGKEVAGAQGVGHRQVMGQGVAEYGAGGSTQEGRKIRRQADGHDAGANGRPGGRR